MHSAVLPTHYPGDVIHGQFLIIREIEKTKSHCLFEASIVDNPQASHVTIKIENGKGWNSQLSNEADVLKELDGHKCFPRFDGEGNSKKMKYVVMELLDDSLRTIITHSVNNRLPVALQQHYALSMLSCIESLHELGWMHNNISPEHFVRRNNSSAENELVLIAFSHATRLNSATPSLSTRTSTIRGKHCAYVSLNCHRGEKESWRDDLWSWFFIVLEMNVGRLPWSYTDTWEESFAKKIGWERGMKQLLETNPLSFTSVSIAVPINPSTSDAGTFSHFSSASSPNNKNAAVSGTEPFSSPQHSNRMPQTPSIFVALFKLLSDLRFGEKADFREIRRILHLFPEESENRSKFPCPSPTENRTWSPASHSPSLACSEPEDNDINEYFSPHFDLPVRHRTTEWTGLDKNGTTSKSTSPIQSPSQSEISPHSLSNSFDHISPFETLSLLINQTPFPNSNSPLFLTPSSSFKVLRNPNRKVVKRKEEDTESTLWSHSFTISSDDDSGHPTPISQTSSLSHEAPTTQIPFSISQQLPHTAVGDMGNRQPEHVPLVTQVKRLSASDGGWVDEEQLHSDDTDRSDHSLCIPLSELSAALVKPEEPDKSIISAFSEIVERESVLYFENERRDVHRMLPLSEHRHHHHPHHITLADRAPFHDSLLTTPHPNTFTPFFVSAPPSHPRDPPSILPASSDVSIAMSLHTAEYLLFDVTRLSLPPTSDAAEGRIGVGTHSSSVPNYFRVVSDILSPSSPFHALPQPSAPNHVPPSLLSFPRFIIRICTLVLDSVRSSILFTGLQRTLLIMLLRDRGLGLLDNSSFRVDFSLSRSNPITHLSVSISISSSHPPSSSSSHHQSSSFSSSSLWIGKADAPGQDIPPPSRPIVFSTESAQRDGSYDLSPNSSFCYLPSFSLADQLTSVHSLMGEESVDLTGRPIGELLSHRRRKARGRRDQDPMNSSSLSYLSTNHRSIQSTGSSQILYDLSDSNATLSIGDPFQPHLDMTDIFLSLGGDGTSTRRTQLVVNADTSVRSGVRRRQAISRVPSPLRPFASREETEIGMEEEGGVLGENDSEEKRTVVDGLTRSYSFPLLSPTQTTHLPQPENLHLTPVRYSTTEHSSKETEKENSKEEEQEEEEDNIDDDMSEEELIESGETESEGIFNLSPVQSFTPRFATPTTPARLDENGAIQRKNVFPLSLLHSTFTLSHLSSSSLPDTSFNQSSHSPSHLRHADSSLLHSTNSSNPQTESQKSISIERVSLSDPLSGLELDQTPFSTRSATILPTLSSGRRHFLFGFTSKDDGTSDMPHPEILDGSILQSPSQFSFSRLSQLSPHVTHDSLFNRVVSPHQPAAHTLHQPSHTSPSSELQIIEVTPRPQRKSCSCLLF
ncbi:putative Tau-tubulin kinase 1 [Blattamonas nauphoetae]|uniref:Tau-tubulin kinase 1 n=1 Tax=Blattamonas nauphoetae TaxID=2049346 RepID=A0ABQ9XPF8_9EUKA|nr:putative Tau-tubulin kinase 1 [Blattamonas nauphoetae]